MSEDDAFNLPALEEYLSVSIKASTRPATRELSFMSHARGNHVIPQATQVAVVQHNAGTDVEHNLSTLETLSAQAASEGAQLITWAEAFAYLGRHDGKKAILEPLPEGGPILDRCRAPPQN